MDRHGVLRRESLGTGARNENLGMQRMLQHPAPVSSIMVRDSEDEEKLFTLPMRRAERKAASGAEEEGILRSTGRKYGSRGRAFHDKNKQYMST